MSRFGKLVPWLMLVPVLASFWLANILVGQSQIPVSFLGHLTSAQFFVATILMLLVWRFGPQTQHVFDYRWIIFVAVLARIMLVFVEPYTSNDVDRYLFDGYIAAAGLDPYAISHDAEQFTDILAQWQPPQEHLKYVTLYPPLAISLYAIAANFGAEAAPLVWNLMVLGASLATLWLSMLVLKNTQKLQHLALIAMSPILIFESGIGTHIDSFAVLFVVMAMYFWVRARYVIAGFCIGLGTLVKLLPLVLIGALWIFLRTWRDRMLLSVSLLTSVIIGYGGAVLVGWTPIGSLGLFFEKFRFGSPIFTLLEAALPKQSLFFVVLTLILLGYFAVALYVCRTKNSEFAKDHLYIALQISLSLPLIFGPVVYPWYLMTLVPLIALRPSAAGLSWLALLPFTYEVLGQWLCCEHWQPAVWPLMIILVGLALAFIIPSYRNIRSV